MTFVMPFPYNDNCLMSPVKPRGWIQAYLADTGQGAESGSSSGTPRNIRR